MSAVLVQVRYVYASSVAMRREVVDLREQLRIESNLSRPARCCVSFGKQAAVEEKRATGAKKVLLRQRE